jgi:hypothetical protein
MTAVAEGWPRSRSDYKGLDDSTMVMGCRRGQREHKLLADGDAVCLDTIVDSSFLSERNCLFVLGTTGGHVK